ncbi:MAG TPA: dihydrofolate reductase [Blastocatellia bacterium]|nr:dihydrofolate reductase [Blastocatellia bacterium]
MTISIVAALGRNRAIGYQNQLPWRLPTDLQRFKQLTMGHHLLMGRKTFESIGRPLPGRTSIIITRQPGYEAEGCLIAHSLDEAIALAKSRGEQEAFVIGGADIYAQTIPRADRMYLTFVEAEPEADALFPRFDESDWEVSTEETFAADEKNQFAMRFVTLIKK